MQYGIQAGNIPAKYPYASTLNSVAEQENFSAALMYGIALRETIRGEAAGEWNAATVESEDGGHGLFQLTSSYPKNWQQPDANARYAVEYFLRPACAFFVSKGLLGEALIRCIAASFNAGTETAWEAHLRGDVDSCTTGGDYGADVYSTYNAIISHHSFE